MSVRHVLHIFRDNKSGEWQAWCCCGWVSHTWRSKLAVRTAADTHAAAVNRRAAS
jgi:hypothetical protein